MKTLTQPGTGRTFRLGRRRPVARGPRLSLRNYLTADLPLPPPSGDYTQAAMDALGMIDLNDQLGDCVIAEMAHTEGVWTGNANPPPIAFTDSQLTSMYSAIGGYVPGDPSSDQGCDEVTALNYWTETGFCGHKIAGWLAVDPALAATAVWLFENVMFGVELPDAWISPMPGASGFTWGVAGDPDPDNGHSFLGCGWTTTNDIRIATWGMLGTITAAAVAKYASTPSQGELYTALSREAVGRATSKAPNGLDWAQLTADAAAIGMTIAAA